MGSAERELTRLVRRFSLIVRVLVAAITSLVSLAVEPARQPVPAALVVIGFNLWNLGYAVARDRARGGRWLVPVDVAVVCAVCLAQVWTASPQAPFARTTWVLASASIAVVAYPWHTRAPVAAGACSAVVAAYLVGAALTEPGDWGAAAPLGLWLGAEAVLSRAVLVLVRAGARSADELVARGERARRDAAVAAARRDDEREYLAALHDTASATLLMVGTGVVRGRAPWLAEQAARDLAVIRGQGRVPDGEVDLVELVRGVVEHVPLRVSWHADSAPRVPAVVAVALSYGTREALTNVVRHARTDHASVSVRRAGGQVLVEVADQGRGFDPERVPEHRYGVRRSLVDRLARAGGRAVVTSRPGQGTVVRMEWPDEPD
ncbi:Histidine kinase-like ATPase domain-containing protein [Goodfellowiella coeruleoviolacea]|uniref:Histidine kinase-like ATPase domain-containing protein n=2 Tax=Goodfellowiella coeruleoviolacea TaxID=334858 RepID=A0AAE3GA46_9PSEU|nr:Histidine kinase-like ATPase domain-containing protein [Goodfellowiella coeruleoviolacea]